MSVNKKTKWILSSLGLLSVAFSLVMLFTTTVVAGCQATAGNCPSAKCSLDGPGTCTSDAYCVTCTPAGQNPGLPTCCMRGD